MIFVDIDDAIAAVAACLPTRGASQGESAEVERASCAAAALHRELFNEVVTPPRPLELSETTGQPLFMGEEIRRELLEMLKSVAGWHARWSKERARHADECARMGAGLDEHPIMRKTDHGKYGTARFRRERKIGFDQPDLVRFLDACGIEHGLGNQSAAEAREGGEPDASGSAPARSPEHGTQSTTSAQGGLTTDDIIEAFRDVGKTDPQWRELFRHGSAKWLQRCKVARGRQGSGGKQPRWDPVKIGQELATQTRPSVSHDEIDRAFRTRRLLRPFLAAWRDTPAGSLSE